LPINFSLSRTCMCSREEVHCVLHLYLRAFAILSLTLRRPKNGGWTEISVSCIQSAKVYLARK